MLHLVSQPAALELLPQRIMAGDAVLLQRAALWAALAARAEAAGVNALIAKQVQVYVLQEWLTVNGVTAEQLAAKVQVIDYPGMVTLTERHAGNAAWN